MGCGNNQKRDSFPHRGYDSARSSNGALVEYLAELAVLFGNKNHVHFLRVETGSAPCVIEVDQEYEERVFTRVKRAMFKRGPNDAVKSNSTLRAMLKKDELWAEEGER